MKQLLTTAAIALLMMTTVQAQVASNPADDSLICQAAKTDNYRDANPRHFPNNGLEGLRKKDAERRREYQVRCDELRREYAERQRQANVEAEQRRQKEQEQARLFAERQKQQKEAAAAQTIIDAKPINRLLLGYHHYAFVKFCNDVRQGYAVQYVNDAELQRANTVIKALVAQTTAEDASINTDDLWKQALRSLEGQGAYDATCRNTLIALFNMSPTPVYQITKP